MLIFTKDVSGVWLSVHWVVVRALQSLIKFSQDQMVGSLLPLTV